MRVRQSRAFRATLILLAIDATRCWRYFSVTFVNVGSLKVTLQMCRLHSLDASLLFLRVPMTDRNQPMIQGLCHVVEQISDNDIKGSSVNQTYSVNKIKQEWDFWNAILLYATVEVTVMVQDSYFSEHQFSKMHVSIWLSLQSLRKGTT